MFTIDVLTVRDNHRALATAKDDVFRVYGVRAVYFFRPTLLKCRLHFGHTISSLIVSASGGQERLLADKFRDCSSGQCWVIGSSLDGAPETTG